MVNLMRTVSPTTNVFGAGDSILQIALWKTWVKPEHAAYAGAAP
jgi:hypothetical protein